MSKAYLEITLQVSEQNRSQAGGVYAKFKQPFLGTVSGSKSKELLLCETDVQVLHEFNSTESAESYLKSALFQNDVVSALTPYLIAEPEIRIYEAQ